MINRVKTLTDLVPVKNIIVTTADKNGLEFFIPGLLKTCGDLSIYSTGGTFEALRKLLPPAEHHRLKSVSDYTGQPEIQGGLVKTLDYLIYLGLLSEPGNTAHENDLKKLNAVKFDMVVVNLYPFSEAFSAEGANIEDARSHIDIGGPCMLRAAAKNFLRTASVCSPSQYSRILEITGDKNGCTDLKTRYELAREAFTLTAGYDTEIAASLEQTPHDRVSSRYIIE